MMRKIVVIGGGFAGLWSAVGAARVIREAGATDLSITLVNRDGYLTVRPRLYERSLEGVRVPLDQVLSPIGVRRVEGTVTGVDTQGRTVAVETATGAERLAYDRLVLAAGSQAFRPGIPGLKERAFSVDTFAEATVLAEHLASLRARPAAPGRFTAVVVGAGLTGIEVVTEMATRIRELATEAGVASEARIVLVGSGRVAAGLGPGAQSVIDEALAALGVAVRERTLLEAVTPAGAILSGGELLPAATVIWAGGLRASSLTQMLPVARDPLGRLPVDQLLRVEGVDGLYAAGDVAKALTDGEHEALISCQHAIPQGKIAGHNVAADLLGLNPLPYRQEQYNTCVDLGDWGGLFTVGWDRVMKFRDLKGKEMKQLINRQLIYPPLSGDADAILQEADPEAYSFKIDPRRHGGVTA